MKGDIPLLKTQLPVIVMETPSRIPTVSINNQFGFGFLNLNFVGTLHTARSKYTRPFSLGFSSSSANCTFLMCFCLAFAFAQSSHVAKVPLDNGISRALAIALVFFSMRIYKEFYVGSHQHCIFEFCVGECQG